MYSLCVSILCKPMSSKLSVLTCLHFNLFLLSLSPCFFFLPFNSFFSFLLTYILSVFTLSSSFSWSSFPFTHTQTYTHLVFSVICFFFLCLLVFCLSCLHFLLFLHLFLLLYFPGLLLTHKHKHTHTHVLKRCTYSEGSCSDVF